MGKRIVRAGGYVLFGLVFVFGVPAISSAQYNETLTIVTYYPSPYGVYDKLRSNQLRLGNVTADTQYVLAVEGRVNSGIDHSIGMYAKNATSTAGILFALNNVDLNNHVGASIGMGNLDTHFGANVKAGDLAVVSNVNHDLQFVTTAAGLMPTRMIIKNNGQVGVGQVAPISKFTVNVTSDFDGIFLQNGNDIPTRYVAKMSLWGGAGQVILKDSAYISNVTLDAAANSWIKGGNVGIGTSTPGFQLDVAGEARISGISAEVGKAVCVKANGSLGTCTSAVGATGICTCS